MNFTCSITGNHCKLMQNIYALVYRERLLTEKIKTPLARQTLEALEAGYHRDYKRLLRKLPYEAQCNIAYADLFLNSFSPSALNNLLVALSKHDRLTEAAQVLRNFPPENLDTHSYHIGALLLIDLGRPQEAIDLLASMPDTLEAENRHLIVSAMAFYDLGNFPGAKTMLEQVPEAAWDAQTKRFAAALYWELGLPQKTIAIVETIRPEDRLPYTCEIYLRALSAVQTSK